MTVNRLQRLGHVERIEECHQTRLIHIQEMKGTRSRQSYRENVKVDIGNLRNHIRFQEKTRNRDIISIASEISSC